MARDLNKCMFVGRLGQDPEARYSQGGNAFVNISIACGDDYKDRNTGNKVEKTNWIPLVFRGKLAEIAAQYLNKGSLVYVETKYSMNKWQDKDGNERMSPEFFVLDMQMLGGKKDTNQQSQKQSQPIRNDNRPPAQNFDDFDQDIPF